MSIKDTRLSFRLSDEVYDLLMSQPGDTKTEKLEFLIRTCVQELPVVQKELSDLRKQIASERQHLRVLRDQKSTLAQNVNQVNYSLKSLLGLVERSVTAIEETGVSK